MNSTLQIAVTMGVYMLVVIAIGLYFAKRAQQNTENYFLGGRSLGPWVAAMSAEASDMSGWLLMGLPRLNDEDGITVVMISHDLNAALQYASHILHIGDTVFFGTKAAYLNKFPQAWQKGGEVK